MMNNKKNFISALILQFATIIQGFVLPRLIIITFGSDVNGLISSITQFLSFISLLEGGLGAVVLAELYAPLEENNKSVIRSILSACQHFFNKLAVLYVIYTLVLSVAYPVFFAKDLEFGYVCTMVLILSLTTIVQYLFSITNKLLLQACQKIYIVNFVMAVTVVLNLLVSVIIIALFPEIHVVKLGAAIVFILQPIVFSYYVPQEYKIRLFKKSQNNYVLKDRWSGFVQNLAYFINMNTDIAVVTAFLGITNVSVYSVYMLAINALRTIIVSMTNSYQSALGKYYAKGDFDNLKKKFEKFESAFWIIGIILFSTCLLLINGFVALYTTGINDAKYYQPIFAALIILANMIYCVREPYRLLLLAAGKFKETNFGSMVEALLNIVISVLLVHRLGLVGIAVGTLVAVVYRMIYFIRYLNKDVLFFEYRRYMKLLVVFIVVVTCNGYIYLQYPLVIHDFTDFIIYGVITVISETVITVLLYKFCTICENIVLRKLY